MLHDVLIPCRVGTYYLYNKRVLSFEITPMMVTGMLIEFAGRTIKIKNKQSILLKDFSAQAQAGAIKKIASSIGKYDEIISMLSSSAVVYKELRLPFLERDALQMVVAYEVEALLPFSLDDAVIDFIITHQDVEKKQSTLLVAAVRKEDLQVHRALFEKAELSVQTVSIDMFVLYEIYKVGIWSGSLIEQKIKAPLVDVQSWKIASWWHKISAKVFKKQLKPAEDQAQTPVSFAPKRAELLIDIGFDVVRALYMQDGQLRAVRMIPTGISDLALRISQQTELPYYDVVFNILTDHAMQDFQVSLRSELKKLFEEVQRTLLFFEKQENQVYIKPYKIWFSGFLTTTQQFKSDAHAFFGSSADIVDVSKVLNRLKISGKLDGEAVSLLGLGLGLFGHYQPYVNFLKLIAQKSDDSLLNKQLIAMVLLTSLSLGLTFWRSYSILAEKESVYLASKRQFMQAVEEKMRIDLQGEKSIKAVVEKAEETLNREKALWFSFSAQQEHSVLEYLQDLSVQIDREATGLELSNMRLDFEKVSMTGRVKNFEALDLLEEELMSLQLLQLVEKPRELAFTIQLKPKDDSKGQA